MKPRPRRVYKFLSAQFALRTVVEHRLKISEFADMNDPFELVGVKLSDPGFQQILTDIFSRFGALCLTKSWNNPLLWSHYADKHKGLCLGFDLNGDVEARVPYYVKSRDRISTAGLQKAVRLFDRDPSKAVKHAAPVVERILLNEVQEVGVRARSPGFAHHEG